MFIFITSFTASTLLISLLATTTGQLVGGTCKLPDTEINGTCTVIYKCQYALDLVKTKQINYLRKLQCGWHLKDPLVCCTNSQNYDNQIDSVRFTTPPVQTRPPAITPETAPPRPAPTSARPLPTARPPATSRPLATARTTPATPTTTATEPTVNANDKIFPPVGILTTTASTEPNTNPDDVVIDGIFNDNGVVVEHDERSSATEPPKNDSISEPPALMLPDRKTCGTTAEITDRIFGGEIAGIYEFPWIVRIKYMTNFKEIYACAGTLINERYVLTAAHCVKTVHPIIGVRLGEWDASTDLDCYEDKCNDPPVDLRVENIVVHPGFRMRDLTRDIALVRLDRPVNFTAFIRPICLPTTAYVAGQDYVPEMMYLTAGWGKTETSRNTTVLQKIELKAVPAHICQVAIPQLTNDSLSAVICAGGRKGEDSCQGDSGGPLIKAVTENYTNNWYLFGVTSYGLKNCGSEGVPSIYTRVAPYYDWIISNMYP